MNSKFVTQSWTEITFFFHSFVLNGVQKLLQEIQQIYKTYVPYPPPPLGSFDNENLKGINKY